MNGMSVAGCWRTDAGRFIMQVVGGLVEFVRATEGFLGWYGEMEVGW